MKKLFLLIPVLIITSGICLEPTRHIAPYVAKASGKKEFHRNTCPLVRNIKSDKLIKFKNPAEAIEKGYKPCPVCKPYIIKEKDRTPKHFKTDVVY